MVPIAGWSRFIRRKVAAVTVEMKVLAAVYVGLVAALGRGVAQSRQQVAYPW